MIFRTGLNMWRHPPLNIVVLIKKYSDEGAGLCVWGDVYPTLLFNHSSAGLIENAAIHYYKATLKTVYLTRYKQLLLSSSVLLTRTIMYDQKITN